MMLNREVSNCIDQIIPSKCLLIALQQYKLVLNCYCSFTFGHHIRLHSIRESETLLPEP